ncbi:toxin-activating lysine-acyltransferase [Acinetobacter faecalis]|uniref:toxin-activating lysine-acyltransferase n=1 Tax=Acinetobacter faecalis TaxID=2665161 RepID=UPI002A90F398|nr:toxin-activating lysine-acyltransferase [Acinetobacter faecalis]MDY6451143.1 toxin-activating lysine-acyltransferase [Acinetobacter faecalis]
MKIGNISLIAPSHYPHEHWSEAEVLGSLMWLWQYVPQLKDAPLSYLMTRVVPYIQHRQFAVFVENDRVIGYVSWAILNIEIEKKYIQSEGLPLSIEESNSGDRFWIIDWFSPFDHSKTIKNIIAQQLFPHKVMRSLYHRGKEKGLKIMTFKGDLMSEQDFQHWQNEHTLAK